jgi:hypothetical protein
MGALMRGRALAVGGAVVLVLGGQAAAAASVGLTRANAIAAANAINLRRGDVPGSKAAPNPITAQQRHDNNVYNACAGGAPSGEAWAITQSPTFSSSGLTGVTIFSAVEILPAAAVVVKDMAASTGARALRCQKTESAGIFDSGLPQGETVKQQLFWLPSFALDGVRVYFLRGTVHFDVRNGGTELTSVLFNDSLVASFGRVEVELDYQQAHGTPSIGRERALMKLLIERAKKRNGGG